MNKVCFDIGNVLCHCSFEPLAYLLSKQLNITVKEANAFINRNQKLHDLGMTSLADELRDHFKIHSEALIDEVMCEWDQAVKSEPIMMQLLRDLSAQGVQVALLSNIGLEHAKLIDIQWQEEKFYQWGIKHFSCFVGARKPNHLYYQSFLWDHPEFKGSLYFDDLPENVAAGVYHGFETFQFELNKMDSEKKLQAHVDWIKNRLMD
jgi:FMN phosphatase YigB (HAD superfamily)